MHRTRLILVTVLLLTATAWSGTNIISERGESNKLLVHVDQGGDRIAPEIYGHFAEHLGRCIYGGFWVGEDSDIPNVRGIRTDVVEALNDILLAISSGAALPETSSEVPSLASGGEVLKTGLAIVHEGEHFDGGNGFGPRVALQNCTIYGYDDFVEKVRQAGIDLDRRAIA